MRAPIRILLAALACLVCVVPAAAHPHVWVKVSSELVFAQDGSVTGIRQHWVFDDMYSAFAVQGLAAKVKGQFTRAELAPVAQENIKSLKDVGYFTYVTADGAKVAFAEPPRDYWLDYKDAILTLNFTLPFKQPAKAKDLKVEIYDPTYYIAVEFAKGRPVRLVGAPASCKGTIQWPRELTYAEGKKLSDNPEAAANWGANFANKIVVNCP